MVADNDTKPTPKGSRLDSVKQWLGFNRNLSKVDVFDKDKEIKYQAKRSGLSFATRRAAEFAGTTVESGATAVSEGIAVSLGSVLEVIVGPELARNLGWVAGAIGGKIAGVVGLGLAAAVSASFTQMDYIHKKNNLTDLYRDDIAARLGKEPGKVTVDDLEAEAEHNRTIKAELQRAKKQRNFGVPLAVVATLASFALVLVALPAALTALSIPALTGIGGFLIKAAVSMAGYYAVKTPLQKWGNDRFGLLSETPNDRIFEIQRAREQGETVTPEQVLGVFAKANEKVDALIAERMGKPFDQLTPEERTQAVQALGDTLPLMKLTEDLNTGKVRATQLAFAAEGEFPIALRRPESPATPDETGLGMAQQINARFQERLGLKAKASATTHTERLAQQSQTTDPTLTV